MTQSRIPRSATPFQLKPRQKEDLARAALHDGLVFAWETGLGKSIAAYLWCLLKVGYTIHAGKVCLNAPVLVVGLPDGFTHFESEAALLGLELIPLDSQATFERLCIVKDGRATLPPAFYYTTFTQLTRNGVRPPAEEFKDGVGDSKKFPHGKIKGICEPTLADLLTLQPHGDIFQCVVVDEGVRMKGAATLVGTGIRQLQPRFRLVTTATPIKNRLPDVFFLAAWACAVDVDANARWPYNNSEKEQEKFAENYLIAERNLTKEAEAKAERKPRRFRKLSAEVCNVHGLWKLFAPVILRRRKADMLADIPPKESHIIRVPMGKAQSETYRYHLGARYIDKNGKTACGAKLQALRVTAANPCSPLLLPERYAVAADETSTQSEIIFPPSDDCPFRSTRSYTPKLAACLNLVAQILDNKEQVIIGSVFPDSLDVISARLDDAGVTHLILDGRTPPSRRGQLALLFKSSRIPVLLAGVESMAEMHSFPQCCNAVLYSYSWAWDKFEQFVNRIHRINSPGPVHVWSILSDGSIDRKLDELRRQKGDSQELVLDGKLFTRAESEVNLAELVAAAESEFDPASQTIDEARLELEWPLLRNRLRSLAACWSNQHGALPGQLGVLGGTHLPPQVPAEPLVRAAEPAGYTSSFGPPAISLPAPPPPPPGNPLRNFLLARLRRTA